MLSSLHTATFFFSPLILHTHATHYCTQNSISSSCYSVTGRNDDDAWQSWLRVLRTGKSFRGGGSGSVGSTAPQGRKGNAASLYHGHFTFNLKSIIKLKWVTVWHKGNVMAKSISIVKAFSGGAMAADTTQTLAYMWITDCSCIMSYGHKGMWGIYMQCVLEGAMEPRVVVPKRAGVFYFML